jgi:hypothetical protein
MPLDAAFLEEYSLYRKASYETTDQDRHGLGSRLPKLSLHCTVWKKQQTFGNYTYNHSSAASQGTFRQLVSGELFLDSIFIHVMTYKCLACEHVGYFFAVRVAGDGKTVEKVGQFPPWSIGIDKDVQEVLCSFAELYKHGIVCESQAYGVGAFAYYRRIVELVIDGLLSDIAELISGEGDHLRYLEALNRVKDDHRADVKIGVVKDLLPSNLRPRGINPLSELHGALSRGLHLESDEVCLEDAAAIRGSLIFLIKEISARKQYADEYSANIEAVKKGLEKARSKPSPPSTAT